MSEVAAQVIAAVTRQRRARELLLVLATIRFGEWIAPAYSVIGWWVYPVGLFLWAPLYVLARRRLIG